MTDWLSDVSFRLSLCSGWCFVNTDICLLKLTTELFLCCFAVIEHVSTWWVVWCLDWPETVFGSAFLLLLCSLRYTGFTPGPNDGLHFFVLALNVLTSFHCAKAFVKNLFNVLLISLHWKLLKLKEWFAREISRLIVHHFARQARSLTYFVQLA